MAKKNRPSYEEAWSNAKKICRLNARQVEMARTLGMNPKKLPRLRPSPKQRWKLPVGEFIEECYRKRFGSDACGSQTHKSEPSLSNHLTPQKDVDAVKRIGDAEWQVADLVGYLMNLVDDLQAWLAHGNVAREVLPQVIQELRQIVEALETRASVSVIPTIPRPVDREYQSDDEIPF